MRLFIPIEDYFTKTYRIYEAYNAFRQLSFRSIVRLKSCTIYSQINARNVLAGGLFC